MSDVQNRKVLNDKITVFLENAVKSRLTNVDDLLDKFDVLFKVMTQFKEDKKIEDYQIVPKVMIIVVKL